MRVTLCDQCGKREESRTEQYLGKDYSWIVVEANEDADNAQLCSWSCLSVWAVAKAMEKEEENLA